MGLALIALACTAMGAREASRRERWWQAATWHPAAIDPKFGWVQSPGAAIPADSAARLQLEAYAQDIVGTFADNDRVLAWDVWNEFDNLSPAYAGTPCKVAQAQAILIDVFRWPQAITPPCRPSQSSDHPRYSPVRRRSSCGLGLS
jgi:hypothetical protein